ncbi:DUF2515 domain-containing protein [Bacillus piscicola]|uniref:DUF2515 domain-containing protein n=1 Tax=Bacillus piscicola TaxID=1632684 RepID=UPI001F09E1B7|nr:DUF2515 domain-containing protein [Bacillus piscicola]
MFSYKRFRDNVEVKLSSMKQNWNASRNGLPVTLRETEVLWVKEKLETESRQDLSQGALSATDWQLVERIRRETEKHNRNNVTRTEAYRIFFFHHPELHWAFLAHMVSRNGGWNMTDLQGSLLSTLLNKQERIHLFEFFERANALIFRDAYPQLLLYEESKNQQKNLFYLLPAFHVSRFMKPFWDRFIETKESSLITTALIINEQRYMEERVIQNRYFRENVIETLKFKGQEAVQLTQVIFPYVTSTEKAPSSMRLAGLIIENFADVKERIETGKKLYAILFGIEEVLQGALHFAKTTPHTGSRADFWASLFSAKEVYKNKQYEKERLNACQIIDGAPPFYSPFLEDAWNDHPFQPPQHGDWWKDDTAFEYMKAVSVPRLFDMTSEFCFGLNKLELVVLAKAAIKKR